MVKKTLKFFVILALLLTFLSSALWLAVKYIATSKAEAKAQEIISLAYQGGNPEEAEEKIISITTQIFHDFDIQNPVSIPLYKFRPYLTNRRLPDFFRFEEGVFETLLYKGLCDNAARMLSFVLKQEGLASVQWNMVTRTGAHSALLVTLSNQSKIYVDPLFGLAAVNQRGKLIHPDEARELVIAGRAIEKVFKPLGSKSNYKFYKNFSNVSMAAQGDLQIIEADIPNFKNELIIGEIDHDPIDVLRGTKRSNMGSIWNYVGHRYNQKWVRILTANKSTRIVITLVSDVKNNVITSEPKPEVQGNKMIWNLKAGEKITFYDGRAKLSFKRLNSYIDIDQISFYEIK